MAPKGCKHPSDAFCCVCRQFIKKRAKQYSVVASPKIYEAYKEYFGKPVGDQDKPCAPHFTYKHCEESSERMDQRETRANNITIPRIWREPTEQSRDCYFCKVNPSKCQSGKKATAMTDPEFPSSVAPVPHCPELHVPTPPEREQRSFEERSKSEGQQDVINPYDNCRGGAEERNPYYPNKKGLNDLIMVSPSPMSSF